MRFWLILLALPAGCSWYSSSIEVCARLPEPPEHWRRAFPDLRYEWESPGAGFPQAATLPRGTATLRLPKQVNWPVLAYPRARGIRLPPAGGLFPLDLAADGATLAMSWEHGPAAQVFLALAREGFDISLVNAERLLAEMLARSTGDPGCLDLGHLASRLASAEFRVTDIRPLPARELTLGLPPGTWFLDSPFRGAQVLQTGQALTLPAVPLGLHRLFALDPPGGFDLYVSAREAFLLPFQDVDYACIH